MAITRRKPEIQCIYCGATTKPANRAENCNYCIDCEETALECSEQQKLELNEEEEIRIRIKLDNETTDK